MSYWRTKGTQWDQEDGPMGLHSKLLIIFLIYLVVWELIPLAGQVFLLLFLLLFFLFFFIYFFLFLFLFLSFFCCIFLFASNTSLHFIFIINNNQNDNKIKPYRTCGGSKSQFGKKWLLVPLLPLVIILSLGVFLPLANFIFFPALILTLSFPLSVPHY